ncbi:MAG TPA: adenylate/guanylate cyclase domain-containing protein [Acidimicrobiales bacterium]|nr:adenylate/guanylate cyclase domain-containing protein [Acidimicrobiales bacterium]
MADVTVSDAVVTFLRSIGATDEQIEDGMRECNLLQLPTDLVLSRGATLSAADLAARSGWTEGEVVALWRVLGVAVPDVTTAMFSERDAEMTELALHFMHSGPASNEELFRILGSSLARVAEAAVSLYVQTIEPVVGSGRGTPVPELEWFQHMAEVSSKALQMGEGMGPVFAHHLRDAIDRQRLAQAEVADPTLFRLAVGFVDLVGFTPLSQHAEPSKLLALIGGFEARAFEVASSHHGRIIKHIGDEVMFVALDARAGCAIAHELTADHAEGIEPRGGVVFGDVISRHGDYYGPVVNLASRLAELAIPGEVLVDGGTAEAAGRSFDCRPAGQRLLKGFDAAVEVFSLHAAAGAAPTAAGRNADAPPAP